MFEMHILLYLACAEDAEIWCNCGCFIAYSALKEHLALGTDGVYWRNQSVKYSVGEHLSFLCFRDQRYLWVAFFAPSEQVPISIDGIVMAVERWGFNWKGHV